MLTLSPRLLEVYNLLLPELKTVDVGTDHGYLPAFSVINGKLSHVLACDIGEKPLQNARKTLEIYHLTDKITLRLSDGLKNVSPEEAQQVSVCGMGGTLMAQILEASPFLKRQGTVLVLQPQSHSEDVRKYLCQNGFTIQKEGCCMDDGRLYVSMRAVYTGDLTYENTPGYWYFGTVTNSDEWGRKYIERKIAHVRVRLNALKQVNRLPEEQVLLQSVVDYHGRNCI